MKILTIHSDYLEIEPKSKAIAQAEEVDRGVKKFGECVVVFVAAEKGDDDNPEKVLGDARREIESVAEQLGCKNIVLYPYVHLTQTPSQPSFARDMLMKLEAKFLGSSYKVSHAPFGWYKAFKISTKGHPLSELSREITPKGVPSGKSAKDEDVISGALKAEETLKSFWYILDTNGKMFPLEVKDGKVSGYDFGTFDKLKKFAQYEMAKTRMYEKDPLHIRLMRKLELVDFESGSDPGNLRYYPKGKLIKKLLEEFITKKIIDYGGLEIESPIMYDYTHPALEKYLHRFPARQYTVNSIKKQFFLRFSACFGQFLMANQTKFSYKQLPLRFYELTRYSFRLEQSGELCGLKRLRAFTMPDCHALCADFEQGKQEMMTRLAVAKDVMTGIGFKLPGDFEFGLRVVKDFYEEHKEFVNSLVKLWGKPVLVEMWDRKFFYFVMKYEFNFIDDMDKATALSTDQLDVENAERFGITYTTKDDKKAHPIILHLSPSGAIERVMFSLLEMAGEKEQNKIPAILPLWLCPTQVRLCPVSDEYVKICEKLADELESKGIRADVDDRNESISKKVRDAEIEWLPYSLVIGEKEKSGTEFMIRRRLTGKAEKLSKDQFIQEIKSQTDGRPFQKLPLPRLLSKRPIFVG